MKHIDFLDVHKLRIWESLRKSNKETLYLLSIMIRYTDNIMLHLLIAKFVTKLSKNERIEFAVILQMLEKKKIEITRRKSLSQLMIMQEATSFVQLFLYQMQPFEMFILLVFTPSDRIYRGLK